MKYDKSYCEEKGISTSSLTEAQSTLYYIAENMKMAKSISEEGYKHFNMALEALEQGDVIEKIVAELEDTGAYEQEVHGQTEFLRGITYCLGVINNCIGDINKCKAEGEDKK